MNRIGNKSQFEGDFAESASYFTGVDSATRYPLANEGY